MVAGCRDLRMRELSNYGLASPLFWDRDGKHLCRHHAQLSVLGMPWAVKRSRRSVAGAQSAHVVVCTPGEAGVTLDLCPNLQDAGRWLPEGQR